MTTLPVDATALARQSQDFFAEYQSTLVRRTDRMFAVLMGVQWVGGLVTALTLSPRMWSGTTSQLHPHVWAAVVLGLVVSSLPVALSRARPGEPATRYTIAVAQALWSALLIHLTGGRIETHFHIFGSLAFLAVYRDVRVLGLYSLVTVADHLLRGLFWPESIFGAGVSGLLRPLEHAGWVALEDVFLVISCVGGLKDWRDLSMRQVELARGQAEANIIRPLVASAHALAAAMHSLHSTAEEQRKMLVRQAQALMETQTTATELQRTSEETSRQAEVILSSISEAGDVGATAQRMIGRGAEGLEGLRAQVADLSGQMEGLEARAIQLGRVAVTIKDLADQSNMVALNAAIEAARSGEHGRGFAVVASEMRRLARKSQEATSQVRGILDDTRRAIQSVVGSSRDGAARMARDLDAVRASGESLRGLSSIMELGTDSVRRISSAVGQQAVGVTQLFDAVNHLSGMMTETLGRLDAMRAATEALQVVTDGVERVIHAHQVAPDEDGRDAPRPVPIASSA
ncbi:methyl-accepting chemotaxis protein [Myxococcus sp. K15C18031901]|uniref:methyl-accepting chemotaxis protein n=1 Tax=Myxococcus dinghuensis TaxID=2906761 RepID=UPI0020A6F46E|nr:methyl-accepting chemotaxis protein [Myxococcus dinghuensis]MCP3099351.1 methyl-accepting chemotaxis protein [Myxococcus dinghuensis]